MLKIQVKLLKNYLIIANSLMLIILVFLQMEKISIYLKKIITLFEYKEFKIINKKMMLIAILILMIRILIVV